MSRSLIVRKPRTSDIRQLHKVLERALESGQRRRAETILLYAVGLTAVEIAHLAPQTTSSMDRHSMPHF